MRRRARRDSRLPVLLAIVLLASSLVPAGFMPSEGRWIELCTRGGLQAALIDPDTGELIDETHVEPPCPWGVLLAATLPATSPAGLVHAAPNEPARLFDGAPRLAGRARVVPPVRAPPNLSLPIENSHRRSFPSGTDRSYAAGPEARATLFQEFQER